MNGRLEVRRWIAVNSTIHMVGLSGDGQFIVAGSDEGVGLYNLTGRRLLSFPSRPLPVHQVGTIPDLTNIYVGTREGWLVNLALQEGSHQYKAIKLRQLPNDLHTLSVSEKGDLMAIGHFSSALSVLKGNGDLLWRRHPEDGTATDGRLWTVALDREGDTLYVGSAGAETSSLAALDAQSGDLLAHSYVTGRVTNIVTLPKDKGIVVTVADDPYSGHLVAYDRSLSQSLWESWFDEPVTALAADKEQPFVAAGVGYEGLVLLLNANTGQAITQEVSLKRMIHSLALSQGRFVVAGTQDGNIAILNYLPKVGRL